MSATIRPRSGATLGIIPSRARGNAVIGCVRPGDIMVKHSDGAAVSRIISFGQLFGRGPAKYTHAGIASSPVSIIEMDGHGLQEHNLLTDNAQVVYDVFRHNDPKVAEGACEAARMMQQGCAAPGGMRIQYTVAGAVASISRRSTLVDKDTANTMLDTLLRADGASFFCSGFVVLCFQMVVSQMQGQSLFPIQQANQLFSLKSNCYQPSYLWKVLSENCPVVFTKIGKVRGGQRVT